MNNKDTENIRRMLQDWAYEQHNKRQRIGAYWTGAADTLQQCIEDVKEMLDLEEAEN